ncbi:MAG: LysM peptidoglycan-binding domain-containing protein [Clostridiales bacterium]|nr:LysM peptidoglycan-binding domain-containing protein [Clostridiales bacterium]
MDIYVVQPGDTIEEIANRYGISVEKLIRDNELQNPDSLLIGQVLVIVHPSKTYRVREGDSLSSIATLNNITVNELLRNNPFLINRPYIYPGEELTISYNRSGSISTYGYTNTFINRQILRKTLPFLTYLAIFDYEIGQNGEALGTDDDIDIIEMAIQHGVIPLMHLATITVQGKADLRLTNRVISDEALQEIIFENVLEIIRDKGYVILWGNNIGTIYYYR